MTDSELVAICQEFRDGLLGKRSSRWQCAKVCWALAPYLEDFHDLTLGLCMTENVRFRHPDGRRGTCNHVWLQLADGRVLDPTADQFNYRLSRQLPPIYLGAPIRALHNHARR